MIVLKDSLISIDTVNMHYLSLSQCRLVQAWKTIKPALLKEEELRNNITKYFMPNLSKEILLECLTNSYSRICNAILHIYRPKD